MSKLLSRQGVRDGLLGLALLSAALALILYPQESMSAAREGLTLCGNVIIPSLFPFFVLSSLVVELGLASYLGRVLEPVMAPLFRVNGACASAFVLGIIGGYPVGAKTALSLYEKGLCSKTEAERLLAFCNNSGPAFILGVVGAGVFASSGVGLLLCLAHGAASLLVGLLFRFYKAREPAGRGGRVSQIQATRITAAFTGSIQSGLHSILNICAFVVFFTVVIRMLTLTGVLPALARAAALLLAPLGFDQASAEQLLTGVVELSSGVWALSGGVGFSGRVPLAAFMLGWAGLSVHCQVLSFAGGSGLNLRTYVAGKLLHGLFSAGLTAVLVRLLPLDAPVSSYLAQQVDSIAGLDFHTALVVSLAAAWVVWACFLLLAARMVSKSSGKRRRNVV